MADSAAAGGAQKSQFAGQETDAAKEAVRRQRELKRKKDGLRKAEKRLKSAAADSEEHAAILQEIEEMRQAIAELEGGGEEHSGSPSPRHPQEEAVPDAAAATGKSGDAAEEGAARPAMQFMGQETDAAKEAVRRQRELKRKKDALRKTQKKLKSLKPEDEAYAAEKEAEAQLQKDIAEMEGATAAPAAAAGAKAAGASGAAAAPPDAEKAKAKAAAAAASEAVEDVEGNAAKLQQMAQAAMDACRGAPIGRPRPTVVHPRVAEVAVMTEEMLIVGGNARTLAMIAAFRDMFRSTTILSGSSLEDIDSQAFTELVDRNFAFLRRRREANAGMRYVKETFVRRFVALRDEVVQYRRGSGGGGSSSRLFDLSPQSPRGQVLENMPADAREIALGILDMIEGEIRVSIKSIVEDRSLPYVSSSDTILVFGRSSVVEFILLSRARNPSLRPKKVIVVDAAPLFEGRELARKLSEVGIHVTYGLISATCTLMPKCTRVFIGASGVLQNGDVFGRCGTALIAACAKSFRKPVLCFAESYKFVSEVWVGNMAQNAKLTDIKDAANDAAAIVMGFDAVSSSPNANVAGRSPLAYSTPASFSPPQPASAFPGITAAAAMSSAPVMTSASASASGYLYDLTPAAYVDMIICEMGCLHTSAIVAAIKDREGRDASPAAYLAIKNSL